MLNFFLCNNVNYKKDSNFVFLVLQGIKKIWMKQKQFLIISDKDILVLTKKLEKRTSSNLYFHLFKLKNLEGIIYFWNALIIFQNLN